MAHLKFWSKEAFGNREKKLKSLMKKLERAKQGNLQNDDGDDVRNIERQIQNLLIDEEVYWKQRSRADWLKEGDKNTKLFHHKVLTKKRKNKIKGVEDNNGRWIEDNEEVERRFCEYFQDLFTTSNPSQDKINADLQGMPPKINSELNNQLDRPFFNIRNHSGLVSNVPNKSSRTK